MSAAVPSQGANCAPSGGSAAAALANATASVGVNHTRAITSPVVTALLAHPAIWRGDDCAPEPAAVSSGFARLDAVLPGRGWPGAALTEMLLEREGIGEIRLMLPALAQLQAQGRDIVWIAPPYRPYAPALAAAGLDLARFLIVRCATSQDTLWAYEQALRAPECGAAFAWLAQHDERSLRRLQVAAREGRTWGVLWRRPGQRGSATAAPLRLALAPRDGRLAVSVLKRRGAELPQSILIDVDAVPGAPARPAIPDARTSTGWDHADRAHPFRARQAVQ
ncbi:MAG: translesion DNA synthesis-associated protein ImuA [Betaproteobacteria bacterium]|nr:translesion DNA synthesis-associated protein ImuA [Betaproteobacteria bacterium]